MGGPYNMNKQRRNAYKNLVGKPEKRSLGR
jgi:hypothetical protein